MTQEKIQEMKDFFLDALPEKLIAALQGYDEFTAQPAPLDFKSFGAFHAACKNALSHMILLVKLLFVHRIKNDSLLRKLQRRKYKHRPLRKIRLAITPAMVGKPSTAIPSLMAI